MLRWKLNDGWVELLCGCGKGGVKCEGATERVVQVGSAVGKGGPLRRARPSARDWERRRSWAERNCGGGRSVGRWVVGVAEG